MIGNCQAGWAVMMLAALRPELFGPIIIAGSPLSYWAGVRGQYPMRYSRRPARRQLADGARRRSRRRHLRRRLAGAEFREPEPGQHALDASSTISSPRSTPRPSATSSFEKWWGGHVTLNAEEIQFIVDELFVGNKLAAGEIRTSDGTADRPAQHPLADRRVLLARATTSPRRSRRSTGSSTSTTSVDDIRAHGQTIVYTVHDNVGHLGIFVSAGVARRSTTSSPSNIDLIDVLPPGLYEAVLSQERGGRRVPTWSPASG